MKNRIFGNSEEKIENLPILKLDEFKCPVNLKDFIDDSGWIVFQDNISSFLNPITLFYQKHVVCLRREDAVLTYSENSLHVLNYGPMELVFFTADIQNPICSFYFQYHLYRSENTVSIELEKDKRPINAIHTSFCETHDQM